MFHPACFGYFGQQCRAMQSFVSQISWESEVWIAEDPDHMIHFNGERFLGAYPDVLRKTKN
jgi:hypothetical protein